MPDRTPSRPPTVLIVPGLRDDAPDHWQSHLEVQLRALGRDVRVVPPIGKNNLSLAQRVDGITAAVAEGEGPCVLVAHSGGCITVAHWAMRDAGRVKIQAALLAVPPDFEHPLPAGYPDIDALAAHGWLPVPRVRLPFASTVVASTNDPLARLEAVEALARQWGSTVVNVGAVGHLNPASGFGPWPDALALLDATGCL